MCLSALDWSAPAKGSTRSTPGRTPTLRRSLVWFLRSKHLPCIDSYFAERATGCLRVRWMNLRESREELPCWRLKIWGQGYILWPLIKISPSPHWNSTLSFFFEVIKAYIKQGNEIRIVLNFVFQSPPPTPGQHIYPSLRGVSDRRGVEGLSGARWHLTKVSDFSVVVASLQDKHLGEANGNDNHSNLTLSFWRHNRTT